MTSSTSNNNITINLNLYSNIEAHLNKFALEKNMQTFD